MPTSPSNALQTLVGSARHPSFGRWNAYCLVGLIYAALGLFAYHMIATSPTFGDENAYIRAAGTLAPLFGPGEFTGYSAVYERGWFGTGFALLLAPLHLIVEAPSPSQIRTYVGCLTTGLTLWAGWEMRRAFGWRGLGLFVIFPLCCMGYRVFGFAAVAEVSVGLMLAIALCRLFSLATAILEHRSLRTADALTLFIVLALAYAMRPSALYFAPLFLIFLLALLLITGRGDDSRKARRPALTLISAFALFALLAAPWMIYSSHVNGGLVLTTTSAKITRAVTFGDTGVLCGEPCPEAENIWYGAHEHIVATAGRTGRTRIAVMEEMSDRALETLGLRDHLRQVRRTMGSYLLNPSSYLAPFNGARPGLQKWERTQRLQRYRTLTHLVYFPFLACFALAVLCVFRASARKQLLSLIVKMSALPVLAQPFVHVSHGRYWPGFAVLFTLSALLLLWAASEAWRSRGAGLGDLAYDEVQARTGLCGLAVGDMLTGLQLAYVLFVGLVALAVVAA